MKPMKAFGGEGGHPRYEENQKRAKHNGHYVDQVNCCVVCGKKAMADDLFVFLSNVGEYLASEAEGNGMDDLGMYPVGSECAKGLKKAGVVLFDREGNVIP